MKLNNYKEFSSNAVIVIKTLFVISAFLVYIAASEGNYNFVKLLLKYHADINIIDKFGITSKEYAQLYNHKEITNLLDK